MLKKVAAVALLGAAVALSATPAAAAATVCYDAYAEANGQVLVDEAGCVQA